MRQNCQLWSRDQFSFVATLPISMEGHKEGDPYGVLAWFTLYEESFILFLTLVDKTGILFKQFEFFEFAIVNVTGWKHVMFTTV